MFEGEGGRKREFEEQSTLMNKTISYVMNKQKPTKQFLTAGKCGIVLNSKNKSIHH